MPDQNGGRMLREFIYNFPAAFCGAIVLLVGTTSTFFVFSAPYISSSYSPALVLLVTLLFCASLICFVLSWRIDAGTFLQDDPPPDLDSNDWHYPLYRQMNVANYLIKVKWCSTCNFYRPPRCTHCSICDRCIEDFDHHCPWLNNCVGRRNYRFYLGFLAYTTFLIIVVFTLSLITVVDDECSSTDKYTSLAVCIISGISVFPVGGLLCFHAFLVVVGRTTNEQVTGKFLPGQNPYYKGLRGNIERAFCVPFRPEFQTYHYKNKGQQNVTMVVSSMRSDCHSIAQSEISLVSGSSSRNLLYGSEVDFHMPGTPTLPRTPPSEDMSAVSLGSATSLTQMNVDI